MIGFVLGNAAQHQRIWEKDLAAFLPEHQQLLFVHKWRKRLIVGSESIMWHNGQNDGVCLFEQGLHHMQ